MRENLTILIAEDNKDDALLLARTFSQVNPKVRFHITQDGSDLVSYLRADGNYSDRSAFPFPRMMFIDLKMPVMNGFEVLQWLQEHPRCRVIPTVVMSASMLPDDVDRAYELGANAYFVKPATIDELRRIIEVNFWFWTAAQLPTLGDEEHCG